MGVEAAKALRGALVGRGLPRVCGTVRARRARRP